MCNHYKTSLSALCGRLVYVFLRFFLFSQAWIWRICPDVAPGKCLKVFSPSLGGTAPNAPSTTGTFLVFTFNICSSCSFELLVLPNLFVLRLAAVAVSKDWHIYLNCFLLLLVNHSQCLLADAQLTSQVVSMALYAWGVVMTGKRSTHESKFQIFTLLEEILRSFT